MSERARSVSMPVMAAAAVAGGNNSNSSSLDPQSATTATVAAMPVHAAAMPMRAVVITSTEMSKQQQQQQQTPKQEGIQSQEGVKVDESEQSRPHLESQLEFPVPPPPPHQTNKLEPFHESHMDVSIDDTNEHHHHHHNLQMESHEHTSLFRPPQLPPSLHNKQVLSPDMNPQAQQQNLQSSQSHMFQAGQPSQLGTFPMQQMRSLESNLSHAAAGSHQVAVAAISSAPVTVPSSSSAAMVPSSSLAAPSTTWPPWLEAPHGLGHSPRIGARGIHSPMVGSDMFRQPIASSMHDSAPQPFSNPMAGFMPNLTMPMQATTIVNESQRMRGSISQASSRRPSLSLHSDDEEHDLSSMPSSRRGSLMGLGGHFSTSHAMLPRAVLPMGGSAGSSSMMTSSAPSSLPSSVPTSPMRNFVFFPNSPHKLQVPPTLVTTLVPSPRLTNLQLAGRNVEMLRKKAAEEARGIAATIKPEDEPMSAAAEQERKMPPPAAPATAKSKSAPTSHKKRSHRARDLSSSDEEDPTRRKKKKKNKHRRTLSVATSSSAVPAAAGVTTAAAATVDQSTSEDPDSATAAPMIKSKESAATGSVRKMSSDLRASRMSRRKSVPPAHFGDEDDETRASAAASTRDDSQDADSLAARDLSPSPIRDKQCELCKKMHSGRYGGGRFCGAHCARHYSIVHRWDSKKQGK